MTANRQFSLALQALTELKLESSAPPLHAQPIPALPNLSEVLAEIGPLPPRSLVPGRGLRWLAGLVESA